MKRPPMTKAESARMANSPWRRGPHCDTPAAVKSHLRYLKRAKRARPAQGDRP